MSNEVIHYEALILGACLTEASLIADLPISAADFSGEYHAETWQAMQNLLAKGETPDLVTVSYACSTPLEVLAEAMRAAFSTAPELVRGWAQVVRGHARRERLANGLHALATGGGDADEMLGQVRDLVMGMEQESPAAKRSNRDVLRERLNAFADRHEGKVDAVGLTTGIKDADNLLYGLKPSELIVLAARPGMGKSAKALQIANLNACNHGKRVAFFSLEMGLDELFDRMLIQRSGVPSGKFAEPKGMDDDMVRKIGAEATVLERADINCFDDVFDIEGIEATCRRLHQKAPLDLVVVDYLQLISTKGRANQNRAVEVGDYSRRLKMLAMLLNCPVLVLSQLNRNVETRPDKRPLMADLRESGSVEQDANKIVMIYRDEVYNDPCETPGVGELIVRKNRGGRTGTVYSSCRMDVYSFRDLSISHQQAPEAISHDPFA